MKFISILVFLGAIVIVLYILGLSIANTPLSKAMINSDVGVVSCVNIVSLDAFSIPGTNFTCSSPIERDGFWYCDIDNISGVE
jgi:hypothetical protein